MADYVDNAALYTHMCDYIGKYREWEAAGKQGDPPRINEFIGECIYKIAYHLATRYNFSRYTFKEEMICDGIISCVKYIHNFDPDRFKNPFGYITKIIFSAFVRRIKVEEIQTYVNYVNYHDTITQSMIDGDPDEVGEFHTILYSELEADSKINDLIRKFDKLKKEKKTAKKKGGIDMFLEDDEDEEDGYQ